MGKKSTIDRVWWKEWIRSLLYAALFLILFRNFFFTLYMVKSDSMGRTVEQGDWVAVNLLAYGPRIPSTLVCVPFTPWYVKAAELPIVRIPGYTNVHRNDVVAFNFPQDTDDAIERREVYLKRLIALPGDSVQIIKNEVRVNSKLHTESTQVKKEYLIKTAKPSALRHWIKQQRHLEWRNLTKDEWLLNLTMAQYKKLSKEKFVTSIDAPSYLDEAMLETLFTGKLTGYDVLNFAATRVPFEGMKIALTPKNVQLYAHCILNEDNTLTYKDSVCTINGNPEKYYVFNEDHYFMLGDARSASVDSRHWGFVPRSHLVGRASFVFIAFGNNQNNSAIRWSKCLRSIQ